MHSVREELPETISNKTIRNKRQISLHQPRGQGSLDRKRLQVSPDPGVMPSCASSDGRRRGGPALCPRRGGGRGRPASTDGLRTCDVAEREDRPGQASAHLPAPGPPPSPGRAPRAPLSAERPEASTGVWLRSGVWWGRGRPRRVFPASSQNRAAATSPRPRVRSF